MDSNVLATTGQLDGSNSSYHPHRRRESIVVEFSPPAVVEPLAIKSGHVYIVRDDLLPGGSKQRACAPLLKALVKKGYNEFCYASPFAGFAQVALAFVCSQLQLRCRLFCEVDGTSSDPKAQHEFTRLAASFGAEINMVKTLSEAETLASEAARRSPKSYQIPLGFNCPEFKDAFEIELRKQWQTVCGQLIRSPKRLWLPVGSGTLTSVFRRIVDPEIEICCVDVRVLALSDERIQMLARDPNLKFYRTPEQFSDPAKFKPKVPSNTHYDAKLWQFIRQEGRDGDIWWNVAR